MPRERDGDGDRPKREDRKAKVLDFVHNRAYTRSEEGPDEWNRYEWNRYEWNREKARINRSKHGVELADAALALEDPLGLTMPDPFATLEDR